MAPKNDLSDRRSTATAAKANMIEVYRAAQLAAAPRLAELQSQRAAVAEARTLRHAARDERKREEKIFLATQTEEALAAAQVEAEEAAARIALLAAKETEDAMMKSIVSDFADRKAARDLRYANRKSAARRG